MSKTEIDAAINRGWRCAAHDYTDPNCSLNGNLAFERDLYLGIDPGQSGGLAILDKSGAVVDCSKMPETEKDIAEYFQEFAPRIAMACLELVHAGIFHGQKRTMGVSSAFTFGKGYGGLRMALYATGIPFEDVTPRRWQGALQCVSGGKKNVTKSRAQALFPGQRVTHAVADALLLAEYCRRQMVRPGRDL